MERYLIKDELPTVELEPTATAASISGRAQRTTPSTVANPHFAKASRQLDDSGALHTLRTKQQRVDPEPPTPIKAHIGDALASMPPERAEFDASCLDDAVLAAMPLP